MTDTNEIRFSGTIEKLKSIQTKTGTSMCSFLIKVGQDRFKVVAFKNIADAILRCSDGARVSVSGSGSINSWKDNAGHSHNAFQCTAWGVEIHGKKSAYEKKRGDSGQGNNSRTNDPPLPLEPNKLPDDQRSEFDFAGGPF